MTATPIPRSLCLTVFGDLDLTSMTDRPPGRQPIATHRVFGTAGLPQVWDFLCRKIASGRQAYVVCPRVAEGDDTGDNAAAETVFRDLQAGPLQAIAVGLLHGQQPRDVREATMTAFREGTLKVLVTTTVIEVGVDVPNATLMVIFQAERFGLAQLHQLRGRVGRGAFQGHCFLCSESTDADASARLTALEATTDGFRLAEVDFELRGPGDVLGTRQHGALPLRCADIVRDQQELAEAREVARKLVDSGTFDQPEYAPLKNHVLDRFAEMMDLPQTG
jgi:ATP-dependent DNA helicase RecG